MPKKSTPHALTKLSHQAWFIYILECANGKLYTGITTDLEKRFRRHASGRGAKFTKRNKPLRILGAKPCKDRSDASKREWAIKQLTASQKRSTALTWSQFDTPALAAAVALSPEKRWRSGKSGKRKTPDDVSLLKE